MGLFARYLPLGLLLLFSGKALMGNISPVDAANLLILSSLVAYFEFKLEKREMDQLKNDMDYLKKSNEEQIVRLNDMKSFYEERQAQLSTHVQSMKLNNNIKTGAFR